MLSPEGRRELEALYRRYPTRRAVLLPLLHLVQREHGFVSEEAEEWVAGEIGLAPVKVHEVVTFYTMYHRRPVGRYHLQLCRTLSCALRGAGRLLHHLENKAGLVPGGPPTPDGRLSLEEVECLGVCGNAPVVQVNEDFHVDLTVEKLERLLADPDTAPSRHVSPGSDAGAGADGARARTGSAR